jgi:hypothetical protein
MVDKVQKYDSSEWNTPSPEHFKIDIAFCEVRRNILTLPGKPKVADHSCFVFIRLEFNSRPEDWLS